MRFVLVSELLLLLFVAVVVAARRGGNEEPTADSTLTVMFNSTDFAKTNAAATLVVSPNPLLANTSSTSANVPEGVRKNLWAYFRRLGAEYVRYAPLSALPMYACAMTGSTEDWDVAHMQPALDAFMEAVGEHAVVMDLSTLPAQYFNPVVAPAEDPDRTRWDYADGEVVNSKLGLLQQYANAVYDLVVRGNATDPTNHTIVGKPYNISFWEVNHENAHAFTASEYNSLFMSVHEHANANAGEGEAAAAAPKLVALGGDAPGKIADLAASLNSSIGAVSLHHRSKSVVRSSAASYENFFHEADVFALHTLPAAAAALAHKGTEDVPLLVDFVATLLDDTPSPAADVPDLYWLASGSAFAYLFARAAAAERVLAVAMGLYSAYPALGDWGIADGVYPSLSMTNWTTGEPNARYWALKMLIDHVPPGTLLLRNSAWWSEPASSSPFCARSSSRRGYPAVQLLCEDPLATIAAIDFAEFGVVSGTCDSFATDAACRVDVRDHFERLCLGNFTCTVPLMPLPWAERCTDTPQDVAVRATCRTSSADAPGIGVPAPAPDTQLFVQPLVSKDARAPYKLLVINKHAAATVLAVAPVGIEYQSVVVHTLDATTSMADGPRGVQLPSTQSIPVPPFALLVVEFVAKGTS